MWAAGKPLRVVQALNRARKISADDPEYHVQLVTFAHGRGRPPPPDPPASSAPSPAHSLTCAASAVASTEGLDGVVREVVEPQLSELLGGSPVPAYADAWLSANRDASAAHRVAGAKALLVLAPAENAARAKELARDGATACRVPPADGGRRGKELHERVGGWLAEIGEVK